MHSFAQKPQEAQQATSAKPSLPEQGAFELRREVRSTLHLQRTVGNQAVQRMLQTYPEGPGLRRPPIYPQIAPAAAPPLGGAISAGLQRCGACGGPIATSSGSLEKDTEDKEPCPACAAVAQKVMRLQAHDTAGLTPTVTPGVLMGGHSLQRWPGDGMSPPGDCNWATYLGLRGVVETAKAIVSTLGTCSPGDSCVFLATKIAAITAEIAARVALDATCFRGGDTGHRQQVQNKINMVNRCYRFFADSNCPQALVEAMRAVVERAREIVAAAAIAVVAVAAVAALIAALIVLVEAIIAAGAAAAAAGSAAAVLALLLLIQNLVSDEESQPTA